MTRRTSTEAGRELVTPRNAKRAVAVGKVLAPVLLPVAVHAAGVVRGLWDERRARRLGVAPGELNNFSGRGGALHARIAVLARELHALGSGAGSRSAQVSAFVADTEPRLADLAAALRAAELMPTERRRAAHRAVAAELDRIEPALLGTLGVHGGNGS